MNAYKKTLHNFGLRMLMIVFMSTMSFSCVTVFGESISGQSMGFTYKNKLPENQISEGAYFDLLMKSGQKQTVITEIMNLTNEDMKIEISISNAATTSDGMIDYRRVSNEEQDMPNKQCLTDFVQAPKEISLPPNSKKEIPFVIEMPSEKINGVILGGIQLRQLKDNQLNDKAKGISLKNDYVYLYSMSLRESLEEVPYNFSYESSTYQEVDGKNTVITTFTNLAPRIIKEMEISMSISSDKTQEVIVRKKYSNLKMAPQSSISLALDVDKLPETRYKNSIVVMVAGQKWEWEKPIRTNNKEKKEGNGTDVNTIQAPNYYNSKMIILYIVVIILGFIILVIMTK